MDLHHMFGEKIKNLRELNQWTQKELAAKTKLTQPLISDIEKGKRKTVTITHVQTLASAFGLHPSDLFSITTDFGESEKTLAPFPPHFKPVLYRLSRLDVERQKDFASLADHLIDFLEKK